MMRLSIRRHVAAIGLFACATALTDAQTARGEIRVLKGNGDPVPASAYSVTFNSKVGGYDLVLTERYNPGLDSVFDIRANASEFINSIIIAVDGPSAGSPIIVKVQGEPPGFLSSVGSIVQTGTGETILNRVQTSQDVGTVVVEAIGDIIAGRDVIGPITATTASNPVRGITSVQAVRDILGDCTADNGRILLVWAQRHIGSQADPILIRARHSVYQVMGDDVFADIHTRHNGGSGGFWALVCNRYSGLLSTEKLIFNSWNGLDARIAIYQQFDGVISIGKSYNAATQYIELPPLPTGFSGQIVVNADGVGNGVWSAPVRIGPNGHPQQIVLNSPGYSQTASQIGGGAIGLVPFRLHDESCLPANGSTVSLASGAPPLTVRLRHYGPINYGSTPVLISRRPAGSSVSYSALPMSNFAFSRSSDARSLQISAAPGSSGFEAGWQYRVQAMPSLYCDISVLPPAQPSAPSVAWEGDYVFTIAAGCTGDVNADGAVSVADLLLVIGAWGPVSPVFPAADINGDGFVNVTDLLAVIGHWGACP